MSRFKDSLKKALEFFSIECRFNPYIQPQAMQERLTKTQAPVIFDVGAHHGQTYLEFRNRFEGAHIHLIEPFSESASLLKALTVDDRLCHLHQLALAATEGQQSLYLNEASATNSLNALTDGAAERWSAESLTSKSVTSVEVTTLDRLCSSVGIAYIDILKIDVQGAEYLVLEGAQDLLASNRIGLVQFEFISEDTYENQKPLHQYLKLMDDMGYRLVDFYQPLRRDGILLQCDLLFQNAALPSDQAR